MNLLFRLIWVMWRAWMGPVHRPITASRKPGFRVWLTDQDMFLHMTNSRYLSFSDLGRTDLMIRTRLRRRMRQNAWKADICGQIVTINRMLKAPDSFVLETRICGWDAEYIAIAQTFLRQGKNHASVSTLLQVRDRHGQIVTPQTLIDALEPGLQSPAWPSLLIELQEQTAARVAIASK